MKDQEEGATTLNKGQQNKEVEMAHDIPLTATLVGGSITVSGPGGANLPKGSGNHRFNFELDDQTNLNVKFREVHDGMLDVKDNSQSCPPPAGMDTDQIVGVARMSDTRAGFTDKNDNRSGPMPVCYQLNFECDDPTKHPIAFDPIIINGGQ